MLSTWFFTAEIIVGCLMFVHYFQIRNHDSKYGKCEVPLDIPGYTVLTMDTLQTKCGDTKVGLSR